MSIRSGVSPTTARPLTPAPAGRVVATDGRVLPLVAVALRADAAGGLARVVLEQRFRNVHADPLHVTYQVPLPVDGAVTGFAFRVGDRRVVGEIDRRAAARERFEAALLEGRSAALLEEDRAGLFTQEVGNVPPGGELVAELTIDQRLRWLAEGAWEWRFPTVVAPRYLGAEGRIADAARIAVDVAAPPPAARLRVALAVRDALAEGGRVASPSHALRVEPADGALRVTCVGALEPAAAAGPAGEPGRSCAGAADSPASGPPAPGVPLDRDVVVCWPVARPAVGVALDTGRPAADRPHADAAYGLLTLVPPAPGHLGAAFPRDLIVLLDTSGSMAGAPLARARDVVAALVESLHAADRLELVAFADRPRRWRPAPAPATPAARAAARRWLDGLEAGGGTEMAAGIAEALRPLRADAQRQVVLVTDGLVGFEAEIVATIAGALPAGSRLHAVGVGPSVNRALTVAAARAGRGAEVLTGLDEDPGAAAARLVARTRAPLLTGVEVDGPALAGGGPVRAPDVLAAGPALVALRLRPGGGALVARGRTPAGPWEARLEAPAVAAGAGSAAVVALCGREAVEDLEVRRAAGETGVDAEIERLGLAFGIATRLTSWVAVSEEPTVDPAAPFRRERMPQALPAGLAVEGLGLRPAASAASAIDVALRTQSHFPALMARAASRGLDALRRPASAAGAPPGGILPARSSSLDAIAWRRDSGRRGLHGRVVHRAPEELVIELGIDHALAWDPQDGEVTWADGTRTRALIDPGGTTRPGELHAGQLARLVLRLDAAPPAAAPVRLVLVGPGGLLIVDVEAA